MDEYAKSSDDIKGNLKIKLTFSEYGGNCINALDACVPEIQVTTTGIDGVLSYPSCSKPSKDECKIEVDCDNCNLSKTAKIDFSLRENNSYAHKIKVDVEAESSIPDKSS